MTPSEQQLRVYQTKEGGQSFNEWFDSIRDPRAQQRIDARLARVRLGNFGDSKSVEQGVLELRIDYGPGYRIYFGRDGNELVILLLGGDKRTQARDISTAQKYWSDYNARKAEETHGAN